MVLVRPKASAIRFGLRRLFQLFREGADLESQRELQEGGILRPEAEQGTRAGEPRSLLNRVGLVSVGIVGLASVAPI